MLGVVNASFNTGKPDPSAYKHFRVRPDRSLDPIEAPAPLGAVEAPPEFGPFGGHLFYVDEGEINLATDAGCDEYAGDVLPYGARIFRRDPAGEVHLFADDFWGSYTTLVFDDARLVLGLAGKSYRTGEFQKPDSAIWEIRHEDCSRDPQPVRSSRVCCRG